MLRLCLVLESGQCFDVLVFHFGSVNHVDLKVKELKNLLFESPCAVRKIEYPFQRVMICAFCELGPF